MVRPLEDRELKRRARRIRLVVTDVDGVLTDTGVYFSLYGEEFRRFSVRDGMGSELLRNAGIETAWMSKERGSSITQRARKLHLDHVYLGVQDKALELDTVLARAGGLSLDEIAYIGDDVNDLGALVRVAEHGIAAAPANAVAAVREVVHFCTDAEGGAGAFRELADSILGWRKEDEHG